MGPGPAWLMSRLVDAEHNYGPLVWHCRCLATLTSTLHPYSGLDKEEKIMVFLYNIRYMAQKQAYLREMQLWCTSKLKTLCQKSALKQDV